MDSVRDKQAMQALMAEFMRLKFSEKAAEK